MFAYRKLVIKFSYLESNFVGKNRVRIIFPNYIKKLLDLLRVYCRNMGIKRNVQG